MVWSGVKYFSLFMPTDVKNGPAVPFAFATRHERELKACERFKEQAGQVLGNVGGGQDVLGRLRLGRGRTQEKAIANPMAMNSRPTRKLRIRIKMVMGVPWS